MALTKEKEKLFLCEIFNVMYYVIGVMWKMRYFYLRLVKGRAFGILGFKP